MDTSNHPAWYQGCLQVFLKKLEDKLWNPEVVEEVKVIFLQTLETVEELLADSSVQEDTSPSSTAISENPTVETLFDGVSALSEIDIDEKPPSELTKCEICGVFLYETLLQHHMENYHPESGSEKPANLEVPEDQTSKNESPNPVKLVNCSICHLEIPRRSLKRHHKKYHKNEEFVLPKRATAVSDQCQYCGKEYKQKVRMERHLQVCGPNKPVEVAAEGSQHRVCSVCGKEFKSIDSLRFHEKTLHQPPKFKCEFCGKMFRVRQKLLNHHQTHTGDRAFQCDKCPRAFIRKTQLTDHMNVHEGLKPYACHICPASFPHRGSLHMHMKCMHTEKTERCDQCPKVFSTRQALNLHLSTHTDAWEIKIPCHTCGKEIREPRMEAHVRKMHSEEQERRCGICSRMIPFNKFPKHMVEAHSEAAHVRCLICGKDFSFTEDLKQHELIHQNPTYKCEECGKFYHTEAQLEEHAKRHKDEKKFQCDLCPPGKGFYTEDALLQHKLLHNVQPSSMGRQFACHLCGETFAYERSRFAHMRAKHKEVHDGLIATACFV